MRGSSDTGLASVAVVAGVLSLAGLFALGCGGGSSHGDGAADSADHHSDVLEHSADVAASDSITDVPSSVDGDDGGSDVMGSPAAADAATEVADTGGADRPDTAGSDIPPAEGPPPGLPPDLHCTTDVVDPLQPEAVLPLISLVGGTVPLCSGWVLVATKVPAELTYRNVLDGRVAGHIALPAPPGKLVVDFERDAAYVAIPSRKSLARVDLKTEAVTEVNVTEAIASVALGNDGLVFVTEMPFSTESGLAVIDLPNASVLYENSQFSTSGIAFDRTGNQLITNFSYLTRYKFDAITRTMTQIERPFGSCGVGNGVVVSPDGKHVLSSCPPTTNSVSGGIYDLSPSSLTTVLGLFPDLVGSAAFSPDSAKVAVMGGPIATVPSLKIADVAGHSVLSNTVPGFGCEAPEVTGLAWSRGAKMIHMTVTCEANNRFSELYLVQAK